MEDISARQCVESAEKLAQQGRGFLLLDDSISDQQADELVHNLSQVQDFR
jgi:hypothetical protein